MTVTDLTGAHRVRRVRLSLKEFVTTLTELRAMADILDSKPSQTTKPQ